MANLPSPCGVNASLDEAKASIDALKEKISGGLESIGDLGSIADTIKAKLAEVNVKPTPALNLQAELSKLPYLTPSEYTAKVQELKNHFGSSVDNLDAIIDKIPKPIGLSTTGGDNLLEKLQNLANNITTSTQDIIDSLNPENIANAITNLCEEVPNVEAKLPEVDISVVTDSNGNPILENGLPKIVIADGVKNSDGKYVTKDGEEIIVLTDSSGNIVKDGSGNPIATTKPSEKAAAPVTPSKNPSAEKLPTAPPSGKFTFAFTKDKLIKAAGAQSGVWYEAMLEVLPKYDITTPERVAAFLGNCRTETNWTVLEENLNYGAKYLYENLNPKKIRFPTYEDALKVERQAEKIANIIYMVGRSLLDPQAGDGWKYRGRGLIQLTFKDNYLKASKAIYGDDRLVTNPDMVAKDKSTAIHTAAWYFKRTNVNAWADKQDWGNCRSITNAGRPGVDPSKIHGYETAVKHQKTAYDVLKA